MSEEIINAMIVLSVFLSSILMSYKRKNMWIRNIIVIVMIRLHSTLLRLIMRWVCFLMWSIVCFCTSLVSAGGSSLRGAVRQVKGSSLRDVVRQFLKSSTLGGGWRYGCQTRWRKSKENVYGCGRKGRQGGWLVRREKTRRAERYRKEWVRCGQPWRGKPQEKYTSNGGLVLYWERQTITEIRCEFSAK